MGQPFVIFDRDGTLIDHVHHLVDVEKVRFKSDLRESLLLLKQSKFRLGVITNQSVIGRGLATASQVHSINAKISEFLGSFGVTLEFILICPHLPDDGCTCRKPQIALGTKAVLEYDLDSNRSYMVGDQDSDMLFGKNLGCQTVQLSSGTEKSQFANYFSNSLVEAVKWIVDDRKRRGF